MKLFSTLISIAIVASSAIAKDATLSKNVTCISFDKPATICDESLVTGNGNMGAMVRGWVTNEVVSLSHCKLYRPTPGTQPPVLVGIPKRKKGDQDRDRFMCACELHIDTSIKSYKNYVRKTNFLTGECIVEATDDNNKPYSRKVVALRPENVIAIKVQNDGNNKHDFSLVKISHVGNRLVDAGIKKLVIEPEYYRCEYQHSNPYNPYAGYEVLLKAKASKDNKVLEAFVVIEPYKKGETTNVPKMKERLEKAMEKGYDALLAEHAVGQSEIVKRIEFELTGPEDADKMMRNFQSGRYNIISSTGGDHIPNLQGLWTGKWDAPWCGSFTFNGNLPAAISFFTRGRTPELNECLLRWIEKRLPDMRGAAKFHYNARGFRIPCHVTFEGGIEVNCSQQCPHIYWHGAAGWMLSRLYDGYRHTLDKNWLKRIYPLMKEITEYYEDVLCEMADGTLGFNPSYSPENWPIGKEPIAINATIDNAIAKQFFDEVIEASEVLNVDEEKRQDWKLLRSRLTPFQVSPEGFFAEWLAPDQRDNNRHRHASMLYPLFDNMPAEIMTNAALVAAVRKSADARISFKEHDSLMAYGYVQIGLAACKIRDASIAERCLKMMTNKSWLEGGGSCHDWKDTCPMFNTDVSGGYSYLISEMLVQSDDKLIRFLPAKPKSWTGGAIRGLLLRGNIILEELTWKNDTFKAKLKLPSGEIFNFSGKEGDVYTFKK